MSGEEKGSASNLIYYSVFDGAFRTRVPEGTPDALTRVNKNNKQVYEREVRALFGIVENIEFEDSDYGKRLKITLDANDEGNHPVITFGVESKDGRDILRKLPGIDYSREVRFMPYSFIPEGETEKRAGVSIHQRDDSDQFNEKIGNYFFDDKTKTYKHGHPTIDWDAAKESEQKIFKIQRDEFLVGYTTANVIPKFAANAVSPAAQPPKEPLDQILEENTDDIAPHDKDGVPF